MRHSKKKNLENYKFEFNFNFAVTSDNVKLEYNGLSVTDNTNYKR